MRNLCIYHLVFNRKNKVLEPSETALVQIEIYFPDGKKKYVGTGIYLKSENWDKKYHQVINTDLAGKMNQALNSIITKLQSAELDALESKEPWTSARIDLLLGDDSGRLSFVDYAIKHINSRADLKPISRRNQLASIAALVESNINLFSDLTLVNIEKFDNNLHKSGKAQPTIHKIHKHIKHCIGVATKHGLFSAAKNPYQYFKTPMGKAGIRPRLDDNEMEKIETIELDDSRMSLTRDLFVFSMYTGLAYKDLTMLTESNLRFVEKGYWIEGLRKKSGEYYAVPLLEPALKIIEKYKGKDKLIFPAPHMTEQNRRLKTLKLLCEFNKELTTHVARHTCATFLLRKGVSLKTVSEILGHSKISTTEIYAKLEREKVREEFSDLQTKLSNVKKKKSSS